MTLEERIERAIVFRTHAENGIWHGLLELPKTSPHRAWLLEVWAPRRLIRAGRVLNGLLLRKATL